MLVIDGRIVLSPSGGSHYMGERLGAKLEIDHVPPGETLQILIGSLPYAKRSKLETLVEQARRRGRRRGRCPRSGVVPA
jgi:hypothetical protein